MNGGKYCVGLRERYKSCNIHECSFDLPGFREQQCAQFNNRDVGIHGVPRKWRSGQLGEECGRLARAVF